jgi:hypothetical protein
VPALCMCSSAPRLREWAYAGFTIDLAGAIASHLFSGDSRESASGSPAVPGVRTRLSLQSRIVTTRKAASPLRRKVKGEQPGIGIDSFAAAHRDEPLDLPADRLRELLEEIEDADQASTSLSASTTGGNTSTRRPPSFWPPPRPVRATSGSPAPSRSSVRSILCGSSSSSRPWT